MNSFVSDRDRARSALLAAAAGDAVGWPQEARGGLVGGKRARELRRPQAAFEGWLRTSGSRFLRYQDPIESGAYSDDTQLLLAVARSCLSPNWAEHLARVELPSWPVYQRGGGRAVLAASYSWAEGRAPWQPSSKTDALRKVEDYFRAGANGVAMRIAPHVIWCHFNPEGGLRGMFSRVVTDGIMTHGHPRALVGALCYAATLEFALSTNSTFEPEDLVQAASRGLINSSEVADWLPREWFTAGLRRDDFFAAWDRTNHEMSDLLLKVSSSIRRGSMSNASDTLRDLGALSEFGGSGTISAAAAVYLASRAGTRPISGLLQAAFQIGADTDTLASMVGAILGAIHGDEWLGQLQEVQDADYIARIALELADGAIQPRAVKFLPTRVFARELETSHQETGEFPDGRSYRVTARELLSEAPWVERFRLLLDDGQSVAIDRVHKIAPHRETVRSASTAVQSAVQDETVTLASDETASVVTLKLPVSDLSATIRFYEAILGTQIKEAGRPASARISDSLVFEQSTTQAALWAADAHLEIYVRNIRKVSDELRAIASRVDVDNHGLAVVDPDGRSVTVKQQSV